jgi:2-haloacid dehalogenase
MNPIYVFDAYGTLLDVHSAVARHASAVGEDAARLSELWRTKQLEYSWVLSLMGRYESFWTLTERALDYALARVPGADRALKAPLLDAYRSLSAYPEVASVLRSLRARQIKIAVLSNGNRHLLESSFASAGLIALIDRLISADDAQVFKTSPRVYELVTTLFELPPSQVTFVSSNRWDVAGARAFGFDTVWINRSQMPDEYADLPPARTLATLNELLDA